MLLMKNHSIANRCNIQVIFRIIPLITALCLFLTPGGAAAGTIADEDSLAHHGFSGAYIELDTDLASAGCQERSFLADIDDSEKIGAAVYVKDCDGFETATVDFTWNGSLASFHGNLSGDSIPGGRIDINGCDDLELAQEANIFVQGGGSVVTVARADEQGHYTLTVIKVDETPDMPRDGLLCFAVFTTAHNFNRTDSLTIQAAATLRKKDGTVGILDPHTLSVESLRPGITLHSPHAGEKLNAGCAYEITWSSTKVDSVNIEYSNDGGINWNRLASDIDASYGSYAWVVPDSVSSLCKIRITDSAGKGVTTESEGHFSILSTPAVSITLPDEIQTMSVPIGYRITNPQKRVVTLRADYSIDQGGTWNKLCILGNLPKVDSEGCEGIFFWRGRVDLDGYRGTVQVRVTTVAEMDGTYDIDTVSVDYNSNPALDIEILEGVVSGTVSFAYTIHDREEDVIDLDVSYSSDGGFTWWDATVTGTYSDIGVDGYSGMFSWISQADLPAHDFHDIRLRVTARDVGAGETVILGPFTVENVVAPREDVYSTIHPGGVPSLAFHNVDIASVDNSRYTLPPKMCEKMFAELHRAGYHFLSAGKYLDYIIRGNSSPSRSVYCSFDDGYKGMYFNLFPLLKKYSVNTSINLITSRINWKGYLTGEQIRELHDSGLVDFQSHTHNLHIYWYKRVVQPDILQRPFETDAAYQYRIIDDLTTSIDRIEEITGAAPSSLVLPFGVGDRHVEEFARESGFEAIFYIGNTSANSYGTDPLHLNRIHVYRTNAKVITNLILSDHFTLSSDAVNEPVRSAGKAAPSGVQVRCACKLGGKIICSSPAVGDDGTVYIGSWDTCLYAVHPDGTIKWKYRTNGGIASSPAVGDDGTVYVGSYDRYVHAVNPDGTLKWKVETWSEVFRRD